MISIVVRTLMIYFVVILAMRLMGKRQLGELQPSELVTTFLISNVASICIEEPDLPLMSSVTPILLIAVLEIVNSTIAWFAPHYASLLFGKPVTVIQNGRIVQASLAHLRMTASDLAETMRAKDLFTPEDILWGVIEPNGSLSAVPMPKEHEAAPMLPILVEGIRYKDNMEFLHLTETWLAATLKAEKVEPENVLVLLHNGNRMLLIPREPRRNAKKHRTRRATNET